MPVRVEQTYPFGQDFVFKAQGLNCFYRLCLHVGFYGAAFVVERIEALGHG